MSKLLKKLMLGLLIPVVYYLIYSQIMPKAADGSSSGPGFLSMLPVVGKLMAKSANPPTDPNEVATQAASLAELSRLLGRAPALSDTSDTLAAGTKERDPMIPVLPSGARVSADEARKAAPSEGSARFPISRSDITAIFWDAKAPVVLMGGKPYQVGTVVRGATITAISRTSVTFKWQNKEIVVDLRKQAE